MKYMTTALADLFMPRACVVCGRALGAMERHLCIWCMADIPLTYFWERTHNPMADRFNERIAEGLGGTGEGEVSKREEDAEKTVAEAIEGRPHEPYAYAAALFTYSSESGYGKIPQALKYGGDIPAGRFFASMLGEKLRDGVHFKDVDVVIPVPLHPLRRWSRGYNQAEIIAKEVAKELGAACATDILKRTRYTRTQTKVRVEGKAANVRGAFRAIRKALPEGAKHVLLIDDVFTTGSTLHECFNALRKVFPGRISVATLAFVDR